MDLHRPSPFPGPVWRAPFWVACMAVVFGGLDAILLPNGQLGSLVRTTPTILPGVKTTPLTTTSGSFEESTFSCRNKGCDEYCGFCTDFYVVKTDCYEFLVPEICKNHFKTEMYNMNSSSWCMWDKVKSAYNTLTHCTEEMADCLLLPWPNKLVEQLFVEMHTEYFKNCPTETLSDPPPNVILVLVMTPICLIPAMVLLVVLKTKNGDRRS